MITDAITSHLYQIALKREKKLIFVAELAKGRTFGMFIGKALAISYDISAENLLISGEFPRFPLVKPSLSKRKRTSTDAAKLYYKDFKNARKLIRHDKTYTIEWAKPDSLYESEYFINKIATYLHNSVMAYGDSIYQKREELTDILDFVKNEYLTVRQKQTNIRKKSR